MEDIMITALTALLGGGIGVAIVTAFTERWKFRANRMAVKEDRAEEREDRTKKLSEEMAKFHAHEDKKNEEIEVRLDRMEKQLNALAQAQRVILLDRILYLGQSYIDRGVISYDDRKRFHDMHESYHDGLGGNGDADLIVKGVDELPLKK